MGVAPIISLVAHCGGIILLLMLWRSADLQAPPVKVIEVQLVAPRPAMTPMTQMDEAAPNAESPKEIAAVTTETPAPPPATEKPIEPAASEMQQATKFYTSDLLRRPENAQVRETLPLLAPDERIVQLCNIEALEQIRLGRGGAPRALGRARADPRGLRRRLGSAVPWTLPRSGHAFSGDGSPVSIW